MRCLYAQYKRFFRGFLPHLLLLLPMAIGITILHEAAHAAAVQLLGGSVTGFSFWPSGEDWGHVSYTPPPGEGEGAEMLISLFPYLFWIACALAGALVSLRTRPSGAVAAHAIFLWLFVAPLGDIGNAAFAWLAGGEGNDLFHAFGRATYTGWGCVLAAILTAAAAGYAVQRRLFRERALSAGAYALLAAAVTAGIALVATAG